MHLKKTWYVCAVSWSHSPNSLRCSSEYYSAGSVGAALFFSSCLMLSTIISARFLLPKRKDRRVGLRPEAITSASCCKCCWSAAAFPTTSISNCKGARRVVSWSCGGDTRLRGEQYSHVKVAWPVWVGCMELLVCVLGAGVLADPASSGGSYSCCWPGQCRARHWKEVFSV